MRIILLSIILYFCLLNLNSNLNIAMKVIGVDDCITKVKFQGDMKYYRDPVNGCHYLAQQNKIIIDALSYQLGNIIEVEVRDNGGDDGSQSGMSITVYLNEYIIKTESQLFWTCTD